MAKNKHINVDSLPISILDINEVDYFCLTHMTANQEEGSKLIEKWLTNKNTIEYLGIWEELNNPNFNSPEFGGIKNEAGTNRFYMSVKQWVERTNAIGIIAKTGKYGGTYAHKDIAFNFGLYISPLFNLLLIKEFQRLKEIENNKYGLEWDVRRLLSKANYSVHTEAVKNYIIPKFKYSKAKEWLLYANEADVLNIALFGCTAEEWRNENPERVLKGENIRDMASINELAILSNIESINATLIRSGIDKKDRLQVLIETVKDQRKTWDSMDIIKSLKKISKTTYIDHKPENKLSDFDQKLKKGLGFDPNAEK